MILPTGVDTSGKTSKNSIRELFCVHFEKPLWIYSYRNNFLFYFSGEDSKDDNVRLETPVTNNTMNRSGTDKLYKEFEEKDKKKAKEEKKAKKKKEKKEKV